METIQTQNREELVHQLVREHFDLEDGIQRIVWFQNGDKEPDVRLIEVNRNSIVTGSKESLMKAKNVLLRIFGDPTGTIPRCYPRLLGILSFLFMLRVLGQVLVVFFGANFLPPMERWYSGLIPYFLLLPIQILFLATMAKLVIDLFRGYGFFTQRNPRTGIFLKWFSYIYFLSMVLRYVITMWLHPELRWFTGTIPIWFHIVLAAFLYTYSHYQLHGANDLRSGPP
jgi:hypothetical protein